MNEKEKIKDELGPLADRLPGREADEAPEGYFDSLPDRILDRWRNEKDDRYRLHGRQWLVAAAVLLLCLIGGGWWIFGDSTSSPSSDISSADAYHYIYEHADEFEVLLEKNSQWDESTLQHFPASEDLEDYLMDEYRNGNLDDIF